MKNKVNAFFVILLFLLSLNFYNGFYYLTLFLFFAVFLAVIINKNHIDINKNMIYIFLFSIFYSLFDAGYPEITIKSIAHDLLYFFGYFSGYMLINKANNDYEKYLLVMVGGTCLHGVLNTVSNVKMYGLHITTRTLPDFWTGNDWTATGQAVMFILIAGYSYYALFIKKTKHVYIKVLTIIGLGFAVFYNLYTASRTIFVVLALVYLLCFILNVFLYKKSSVKYVIPFILIILAIVGIYFNNIFGIREFIDRMPLFNRLDQQNQTDLYSDGRMTGWKYALANFWEYPFGGLNFRNQIGYIHNLWLDAYDVAGIVPLVFLLLFTMGLIKRVILIIKSKKISKNNKILIFGVFLSFLLQFMVEPILEGVPWFFILYCIISGMTERYYYKYIP